MIVFSAVSLRYFPLSWFFIAICWSLFFILSTLKSRATIPKAIWFNLMIVVFLLGILEAYTYSRYEMDKGFFVPNRISYEGGYAKEYFVSDDVLGYVHIPAYRDRRSRRKMTADSDLIMTDFSVFPKSTVILPEYLRVEKTKILGKPAPAQKLTPFGFWREALTNKRHIRTRSVRICPLTH
uniref:Uncharacterized protein n=1 Tax=Candidatus Kentrum sp. MB TaxID=2138164 RepID=A0A450XVP6_9GAMM|nr:MAG: hypothetical protein BECKMB1821G_GA0114241_11515 [Candidatus Kentron sp. MB]